MGVLDSVVESLDGRTKLMAVVIWVLSLVVAAGASSTVTAWALTETIDAKIDTHAEQDAHTLAGERISNNADDITDLRAADRQIRQEFLEQVRQINDRLSRIEDRQ